MSECEPLPQSPFDRCIGSLAAYLQLNGRPVRYDVNHQAFRPAETALEYDAFSRVVTVAVADAAATDQPIMYDAALFSDEGVARSGLVARLTQVLPALHKVVYFDFTIDKTVRRTVLYGNGTRQIEEDITQQEVTFLAEQLDTIGPAERLW